MKRLLLNLGALAAAAHLVPAVLGQTKPPVASAEPTVFREVAAKLDAGGSLYGYLSTDAWLGRLSAKIGELRELALGFPNMQGEDRAAVEKIFGLLQGLAKHSGLESLGGAGVSAIAVEQGLYRMRFVLERAPGAAADGYLWQWFGRSPHPLPWLDWLPAETGYAVNLDLDLQAVWKSIRREADAAGFKPLQEGMDEVSRHVTQATGSSLEDHLASLGGELGVALTLDPSKTFRLPLAGGGDGDAAELPEPALVIALKVKDDRLFGFLDSALSQNPDSTKGEADGARWRSLEVPSGAPFPLKPTVGRVGDYLWITSTEALFKQILKVHRGEAPNLRSTDEMKRLARGLPAAGNSCAFVSQRFSEALTKFQLAALAQASHSGGPPEAFFKQFMPLSATAASYAIGWQDEQGAQSVSQTTQEPSAMLVAAAVVAPTAILAGMTLPTMAQAKSKAQEVQCMNNLKQIALGLIMYSTDHDDTFPPDFKSLKELTPSTSIYVCPADPSPARRDVPWDEFDFAHCSYEYLKPGLKADTASPATTVVARCKTHGIAAMADGSVHRQGAH